MNTFIPRPPVERNVNTQQRHASMRGHPMHDTVPHRNGNYQEDWNMPTIAGRGKRPNVMHESYCGTTSWTDYLIYFETCANGNGWTYAAKGQYIVVCLRGQAQLVLGSLSGMSRNDYLELCSALKTRFSPEHETEFYKVQLRSRTRTQHETLPELCQAVRRLSQKAYPDAPQSVHKNLSMDCVIDALSDSDLRWKVI